MSPSSRGAVRVARRLFLVYAAIVIAPAVVAVAAFAVRDLIDRRRAPPHEGNGHADADALEYTVEEVQAAN
jgi:hypothetical protein